MAAKGHKVKGVSGSGLETAQSCVRKRARTFDVGDVNVELGELLARAIHALVHRLQDLVGVLLHPPESPVTRHVTSRDLALQTSPPRSARLCTYPSLGKLCLISTWW